MCSPGSGVDLDRWLKRGKTPWDAFPDTGTGKMDAETCGLDKALAYDNVELRENARVDRLLVGPDGKRVTGVETSIAGERKTISAGIVILAAGAVNSAAVLLVSGESGVANRSGAVGRHFMNHNCSAVLAIDPRTPFPFPNGTTFFYPRGPVNGVITDGKNRYQVFLSSSLTENATIQLKRKR